MKKLRVNKKSLEKILAATPEELLDQLATYPKCVKDEQYNYAYLPGKIPMCLVAHVDTITRTREDFMWHGYAVWNEDSVLGADDRAGVYAIFEMLSEGYRPHIILTNYEEWGGLGADVLTQDIFELPGVNLFIELDRQGCNEYVVYNQLPSQVKRYIEAFGFEKSVGSFSDIDTLCDHFGIPGVNLSIGFKYEHTKNEILFLDSMMLTINRVQYMLLNPIDKLYPIEKDKYGHSRWGKYHCYTPSPHSKDNFENDGLYYDSRCNRYYSKDEAGYYTYFGTEEYRKVCSYCGTHLSNYFPHELVFDHGKQLSCCPHCLQHISQAEQDAFEDYFTGKSDTGDTDNSKEYLDTVYYCAECDSYFKKAEIRGSECMFCGATVETIDEYCMRMDWEAKYDTPSAPEAFGWYYCADCRLFYYLPLQIETRQCERCHKDMEIKAEYVERMGDLSVE